MRPPGLNLGLKPSGLGGCSFSFLGDSSPASGVASGFSFLLGFEDRPVGLKRGLNPNGFAGCCLSSFSAVFPVGSALSGLTFLLTFADALLDLNLGLNPSGFWALFGGSGLAAPVDEDFDKLASSVLLGSVGCADGLLAALKRGLNPVGGGVAVLSDDKVSDVGIALSVALALNIGLKPTGFDVPVLAVDSVVFSAGGSDVAAGSGREVDGSSTARR